MGITLLDADDPNDDKQCFHVNYWNWRPIVELIRGLKMFDDARVDGLHEPFCEHGLSAEEARAVADALESTVLPKLAESERVLLDGTTTTVPDDGVFHRVDQFKNYSTSRRVLEEFIAFCRSCSGFNVC